MDTCCYSNNNNNNKENSTFLVLLICGLPGSGKSTLLRHFQQQQQQQQQKYDDTDNNCDNNPCNCSNNQKLHGMLGLGTYNLNNSNNNNDGKNNDIEMERIPSTNCCCYGSCTMKMIEYDRIQELIYKEMCCQKKNDTMKEQQQQQQQHTDCCTDQIQSTPKNHPTIIRDDTNELLSLSSSSFVEEKEKQQKYDDDNDENSKKPKTITRITTNNNNLMNEELAQEPISLLYIESWKQTRIIALQQLEQYLLLQVIPVHNNENDENENHLLYHHNNIHNNHTNHNTIIWMDDNYYLKSMRKQVYKICQKCMMMDSTSNSNKCIDSNTIGDTTTKKKRKRNILFGIIYVDTPLTICMERNKERFMNNHNDADADYHHHHHQKQQQQQQQHQQGTSSSTCTRTGSHPDHDMDNQTTNRNYRYVTIPTTSMIQRMNQRFEVPRGGSSGSRSRSRSRSNSSSTVKRKDDDDDTSNVQKMLQLGTIKKKKKDEYFYWEHGNILHLDGTCTIPTNVERIHEYITNCFTNQVGEVIVKDAMIDPKNQVHEQDLVKNGIEQEQQQQQSTIDHNKNPSFHLNHLDIETKKMKPMIDLLLRSCVKCVGKIKPSFAYKANQIKQDVYGEYVTTTTTTITMKWKMFLHQQNQNTSIESTIQTWIVKIFEQKLLKEIDITGITTNNNVWSVKEIDSLQKELYTLL